MLLQQTSNWLMTIWGNPRKQELWKQYPLETLTFLRNSSNLATSKFDCKSFEEITPDSILNCYKWLIQYLLDITSEKFNHSQNSGKDVFRARNDSQIFLARTLSIAFIEHYVMEQFWTKLCQKPELAQNVREVLTKLLLLYGLWSLEKHLGTLYQGGFAEGSLPAQVIRDGILRLCDELKGEAISLVDAIAPPDFIINSCLGRSDGEVYKHLQLAMMQTPKAFERDSQWDKISSLLKANKSKL